VRSVHNSQITVLHSKRMVTHCPALCLFRTTDPCPPLPITGPLSRTREGRLSWMEGSPGFSFPIGHEFSAGRIMSRDVRISYILKDTRHSEMRDLNSTGNNLFRIFSLDTNVPYLFSLFIPHIKSLVKRNAIPLTGRGGL
jgi:hypothetical protein